MILAGDIGGTKTTLALFEITGGRLRVAEEQRFLSQEHGNLEAILDKFLSSIKEPVERACFGVAGPVKDGRCETTNLPWILDARLLAQFLRMERVALINDLEANAYGVPLLRATDLAILSKGQDDARGNAAIISAGTGLGEGGFYWDRRYHHPFATEGGHADFAPRNALETDLLQFLAARYGSVSYERVLSGPGLHNIYQFLRDTGRGEEEAWLREEMGAADPSAVISKVALDKRSDICIQAMDVFVSLYGAEAGNLALKLLATGGLFVGGGIAPKILKKLDDGSFLQAFTQKGRMKSLLEGIPVRVILNERTALIGAAHCAHLRFDNRFFSLTEGSGLLIAES
jgi:glucokinase